MPHSSLVVSLILSNVGSVGKMGKSKIPIVPFVAVELVSRDPVAVVDWRLVGSYTRCGANIFFSTKVAWVLGYYGEWNKKHYQTDKCFMLNFSPKMLLTWLLAVGSQSNLLSSLYLCPYMLLISRRVITRVWKIARCQLPLLENEVSARPLNETYFYSMQIKPILTRKALHKTSFPNWWIFELGNAQMEMEIAIQRRRKISTKCSDYREKGSWVNWISIQIKLYNCRKFDKVDLPLKHTIACLIIFTKRKLQTVLTEGLALVRERALRDSQENLRFPNMPRAEGFF